MGLVELLLKTVEEVKHDNKLLHWDERSASEIVERCASMHKKYADLPAELKETMDNFKLNKLYLLVFASNKFEGSKISLGDTMRLLRSWGTKGESDIQSELDKTPQQEKRGEPPVRREVLQHFLAARHLCEKPSFPLTEEIIRREHKVLMAGLLDDDGREINPGEYRTEDISAQGHIFIPPQFVARSMKNLVNDFNTLEKAGLDVYMLAGWLMAEFVTIHPFNDGNGRMCRLLLNFVFRLRGLPFYCPVAVTKNQRGHYMTVLKNYQKWPYGENARRKYGMLCVFIASVVESDWENFSTNLETIRGTSEITTTTT